MKCLLPPSAMNSGQSSSTAWMQFGWKTIGFAWLVIMIALAHPAQGTGLPICLVQSTTGMPCPGCGMTRSMSCAARGMLEQSWSHHPFGLPFFVLLIWIVVVGITNRGAIRLWKPAYMATLIAFAAFGAVRALSHILKSSWFQAGA